MGAAPGPSVPRKLPRRSRKTSQSAGPQFPPRPVAVAPEVPPTPSTASLADPAAADPFVFAVPRVPKLKIRKMPVLVKEDVNVSEQDIKTED